MGLALHTEQKDTEMRLSLMHTPLLDIDTRRQSKGWHMPQDDGDPHFVEVEA